jgi:hypothetical protein
MVIADKPIRNRVYDLEAFPYGIVITCKETKQRRRYPWSSFSWWEQVGDNTPTTEPTK